ncbi:hypothetical protein JXA27_06650 [Aerococcaceae bacterium zg-B36]|uniref:hypothetical protein n=1 Tax=Aerococcaceae bacterium zg-252 TaxID=2796928 RepID=UPI001BD8F9F3|nr:hypothetical protein [Aerococcaceae bacterium zg-B36]
MPRNTLMDLNNHLFEQLERLNDEELNEEELNLEVKRAASMRELAKTIIDNASLALEAEKLKAEYSQKDVVLPKMIGSNDNV